MYNILDKIHIVVVSPGFHSVLLPEHIPFLKTGKIPQKTRFQHNIATSGSSEGNEMIKSMWCYVLFCISDDIVTLAGCVIINTLSCYLNYFLDVTCLF